MDLLISRISCTTFALNDWITPENNQLPLCPSSMAAKRVIEEFPSLQAEFTDSLEKQGCPVPCTSTSYNHEIQYFSRRINTSIAESNYFQLRVYYNTLEVEERTETLLYDLSNFLSASGGNLGLLMGFSCLSALLEVIKFLLDK